MANTSAFVANGSAPACDTTRPLSEGSPLFFEWLSLSGGDAIPLTTLDSPIQSDDALIVIDMQRDFVPRHDRANPSGGRFGVAEGDHIIPAIVACIDAAARSGALVVATRDYHPHDHCSFFTKGGPFPPHCVQGTEGSLFVEPIGQALTLALAVRGPQHVRIVFKGFHEHFDSFGAFAYRNGGHGRINRPARGTPGYERGLACGCPLAPWTGALALKQSSLLASLGEGADSTYPIDVNAPPDLLATLDDGVDRGQENMGKVLDGRRRLFLCGLALDFCVLDSALNARDAGFDEVYVVLDAGRPAHLPGIGEFGSGFFSEPAKVLAQLRDAHIFMVSATAVCGLDGVSITRRFGHLTHVKMSQQEKSNHAFPAKLGPFGLDTSKRLGVKVIDQRQRLSSSPKLPSVEESIQIEERSTVARGSSVSSVGRSSVSIHELNGFRHPSIEALVYDTLQIDAVPQALYTLELRGPLAVLRRHTSFANKLKVKRGGLAVGSLGPSSPLMKHWPKAPPGAVTLRWAYPILKDLGSLESYLKSHFLEDSPELHFAAYGGFLLLDAKGEVKAIQALCDGDDLIFGSPFIPNAGVVQRLRDRGGMSPVTLPELLRHGATHFCWLMSKDERSLADPSSEEKSPGGKAAGGAFLYARQDAPPLCFPLAAVSEIEKVHKAIEIDRPLKGPGGMVLY